MGRINTYILKQLLTMFGFFALVLVLIYWINRAVRLFDRLIADGQSALVFLEFTSLTLPWMIFAITPIAGFAAVIYVIHRLATDRELVILQTSGLSTSQIARPIWLFAIVLAALTLVLSTILVPISQAQLHQRQMEISENLTARLLTEGKFLTPSDTITFYLRNITAEGELEGVFLNDASNPDKNITYSAAKAFLVRSEDGPRLVLIDGVIQNLDLASEKLAVTRFNDFVINIGQLVSPGGAATKGSTHFTSLQLIKQLINAPDMMHPARFDMLYTLHQRLAGPLLSVFLVLIGFAVMVTARYSRFGLWRPILMAVICLILIKFIEGICLDYSRQSQDALWVLYLPALFGAAMSWGIILKSDQFWISHKASGI
ncbi:MAG: LptF/LptG family permease [Planktomarina sp.]|nr:LptF/LptG family permease [Planktomarina sp.]